MRSIDELTPRIAKSIIGEAMRRYRYDDNTDGLVRLRDGDDFCLLGVIADEAVKRGFAEWRTDEDDCFYLAISDGSGSGVSSLPTRLSKAIGFSVGNSIGCCGLLAGMHDSIRRMSNASPENSETCFAKSKLAELVCHITLNNLDAVEANG